MPRYNDPTMGETVEADNTEEARELFENSNSEAPTEAPTEVPKIVIGE